jgi:hypothetical protein
MKIIVSQIMRIIKSRLAGWPTCYGKTNGIEGHDEEC